MSTSVLDRVAPISAASKLADTSVGTQLDLANPMYGTQTQRFTCVEKQQPNKRWHLTKNN